MTMSSATTQKAEKQGQIESVYFDKSLYFALLCMSTEKLNTSYKEYKWIESKSMVNIMQRATTRKLDWLY